jgi:hypothetical protein
MHSNFTSEASLGGGNPTATPTTAILWDTRVGKPLASASLSTSPPLTLSTSLSASAFHLPSLNPGFDSDFVVRQALGVSALYDASCDAAVTELSIGVSNGNFAYLRQLGIGPPLLPGNAHIVDDTEVGLMTELLRLTLVTRVVHLTVISDCIALQNALK